MPAQPDEALPARATEIVPDARNSLRVGCSRSVTIAKVCGFQLDTGGQSFRHAVPRHDARRVPDWFELRGVRWNGAALGMTLRAYAVTLLALPYHARQQCHAVTVSRRDKRDGCDRRDNCDGCDSSPRGK
jgi:hypothetical protein